MPMPNIASNTTGVMRSGVSSRVSMRGVGSSIMIEHTTITTIRTLSKASALMRVASQAPSMAPATAGTASRQATPMLCAPALRKVLVAVALCNAIATRLVALACAGGRPRNISNGSVSIEPPADSTLMKPATPPSAISATTLIRSRPLVSPATSDIMPTFLVPPSR